MAERCSVAASSGAPSSSPAAVQRAGASRVFTIPTSRSGVQGLHKAEAVRVIEELGLPFSPAWNADELKQIIEENLFPKNETAAQRAMKGISSMKKEQLIAKAAEVGAHTTPGMTNASLKLSIRQAVLMKSTPEPTDFMGFGKYSSLTYQEVLSQYPSHAEWVQKEAKDNTGSSWELVRFALWLNGMKGHVEVPTEAPKDHVEVPTEAWCFRAHWREYACRVFQSFLCECCCRVHWWCYRVCDW